MPDLKEMTLESVAGGVAPAFFARELQRVLQDIDDPNTEAKAKRRIVLEVVFAPTELRDSATISLSCKSKLAGLRPVGKIIHFSKRAGRLLALEHNPNQEELFEGGDVESRPALVRGGAAGDS